MGATQAIPSLGMGCRVLFPVYMVIAVVAILWLGTTSIREEKEEGRPLLSANVLLCWETVYIALFSGYYVCHGYRCRYEYHCTQDIDGTSGYVACRCGVCNKSYFIFRTAGCFGAFILQKLSANFLRISVLCMLVAMIGLFVFQR